MLTIDKKGIQLMKRFFSILLLVLFSGNIFSQNFIAFPVGEYWHFSDARTLGLAGAGSVSNSAIGALLMNPAAMAVNKPGLRVTVATRARSLEERRSFPIFDRFNDINQFGIYAINSNWFANFQGGIQYNLNISAFPWLKSVAVGAFEEVDQSYEYNEEVRENIFPDDPLAVNHIKFDGQLTRYSFGAAFQVAEPLDVGFQVGILQGELDQEESITFLQPPQFDISESSSRKLNNSPILASFGATYKINSYMKIGGQLQLPYSVKYAVKFYPSQLDVDFLPGNETLKYPRQATVGLEYRGQQALQARLNVDVTYEWWSSTDQQIVAENPDISNGLDDVIKIKAGIEHIFFNQVPFRVGVQYRTSFLERTNARILFAAGTGFMGKLWQIDLSGGFSRLDYRFPDLFDDRIFGGDRSASNIDNVEESFFFGMATLKVNLKK